MKILILKPNADIRYLIQEFIRRDLGCNVTAEAASPAGAAQCLNAQAFAVVVIGSVEPRIALELSQLVHSRRPKTLVILFSLRPYDIRSQGHPAHNVTTARHLDFRGLTEKIGELVGHQPRRKAISH